MRDKVIILAGGKGSRLKPYTSILPKPLMPIDKYSILEIIIKQLSNQKFKDIILSVNHQAYLIQSYFGNGNKWGVNIEYVKEDKILSTMGPLKLIKNLTDNFLIMNGDILTSLNFRNFLTYHKRNKNLFTISSNFRSENVNYGVLKTNSKKNLIKFIEKPKLDYQVSMGIYAANIKILNYIPKNKFFGFDHLMIKLLQKNKKINVKEFRGYWRDIGRPEDFELANKEFSKYKKKLIND